MIVKFIFSIKKREKNIYQGSENVPEKMTITNYMIMLKIFNVSSN